MLELFSYGLDMAITSSVFICSASYSLIVLGVPLMSRLSDGKWDNLISHKLIHRMFTVNNSRDIFPALLLLYSECCSKKLKYDEERERFVLILLDQIMNMVHALDISVLCASMFGGTSIPLLCSSLAVYS